MVFIIFFWIVHEMQVLTKFVWPNLADYNSCYEFYKSTAYLKKNKSKGLKKTALHRGPWGFP
jgi:hypothetical protein